jgi:hypothetical protein
VTVIGEKDKLLELAVDKSSMPDAKKLDMGFLLPVK